jgi:hypothetical protein
MEARGYIQNLHKLRKENLAKYLEEIIPSAIYLSGYRQPSYEDNPVFTGRTPKDDGYSIEKYFIKGEGNYVVPYLLFVPDKSNDKAVIFLLDEGKGGVAKEEGSINMLVKEGYTVLAPDLLGIGELGGYDYKGDAYINNISYNISYMAMLSGRSIVGIQASDVVKLSNVLSNKGAKEIYGIAQEEIYPTLLHAAAFDSSISRVALIAPYSSYRSFVDNEIYESRFIYGLVPGALTEYDLPDLAASLAPKKLLIVNMTEANRNVTKDTETDIEVVLKAYDQVNSSSHLKVIKQASKEEVFDSIMEWLK